MSEIREFVAPLGHVASVGHPDPLSADLDALEAELTVSGARSVLRSLSYYLSDSRVLSLVAEARLSILLEPEGPYVVLPAGHVDPEYGREIMLEWKDVRVQECGRTEGVLS
jgi:hypothetical protein